MAGHFNEKESIQADDGPQGEQQRVTEDNRVAGLGCVCVADQPGHTPSDSQAAAASLLLKIAVTSVVWSMAPGTMSAAIPVKINTMAAMVNMTLNFILYLSFGEISRKICKH